MTPPPGRALPGSRARLDAAAARDPLARLPAGLLVDASDRGRVGIRIALRAAPPVARPPATRVGAAQPLPDAPLHTLEYAIVDVETTGGAWSRGHRITEVAAVRVDGRGRVVAEYGSLINPERHIPPLISCLTHITPSMVAAAPRFADAAAALAPLLSGAVFVAHNAAFDWRFLQAELQRAGGGLEGAPLCTVRLARETVPEVRSRSLDALQYFFNVENEARHRAYGDARATARIFRRLLERLDEQQVTCWGELLEFLRQRAQRKKRTASPHAASDV